MRYRLGVVAVIAVTVVACKSDTQSGSAADTAVAPKQDSVGAEATADKAPVSWTMTASGIGPLHTGMTSMAAKSALNGFFTVDTLAGCREQLLHGAPGKVLVTVVDGRVERFDTKDPAIVTELGARVGDTEARIESLYVGHVSVQPHKYLEKGHYLVVTPPARADSNKRIIFESDGSKVIEYRAGSLPTVSFVEHCG